MEAVRCLKLVRSGREKQLEYTTGHKDRTFSSLVFTGRIMDEDWAEVHAWLLNTHGTVSFGQYAVFTATFFFSQIHELWEILSLATKQLKSLHHTYF